MSSPQPSIDPEGEEGEPGPTVDFSPFEEEDSTPSYQGVVWTETNAGEHIEPNIVHFYQQEDRSDLATYEDIEGLWHYIDSSVRDIDSRYNHIDNEIGEVRRRMEDIETNLEDFQLSNHQLIDELDGVNEDIGNLNSNIGEIRSDIRDVRSENEDQVESVHREMKNLYQMIIDYFAWPAAIGFATLTTLIAVLSGSTGSFAAVPAGLLSVLFWVAVVQFRRNNVEDASL